MGPIRLDTGDESHPSTTECKRYKLQKKLLHDCGAVNHALVPRKLRSAMKKRGRKSIVSPLPIPKKRRHMSNGVEDGAKKSRLNMKQGHVITKDEEEVAETLHALADMFFDIARTNKPVLDSEPLEIKSSNVVEAGSSITVAEDSGILTPQEEWRKINTRVALEARSDSSSLVNSTAQVVKFQSLDDAENPELQIRKQSSTPTVSTVQSDLSLGPRPNKSTPDTIQSCERTISLGQVSAPGIRFGTNNYLKEDEYKGLSLSREVLSSETQIQYPRVVLKPKKSWKKCSAHLYIAHLIKDLQKSARKEGLLQKPTRLTTNEGVEQRPRVSVDNQNREVKGAYGVLPFNDFTHSASNKDSAGIRFPILSHKKLLQDQQQASKPPVLCSSLKQSSDFLSLAAGGYGSAANEGIERGGHSREAFKQFHFSYEQPQKYPAVFLSLSQSGYSSTFHSCSSFAAEAPQAQVLPYTYDSAGLAAPHLQDWRNGGRDAQALFPHLHSVLGSKYHHFSPQQQQLMPVNSSFLLSNVERHNRHLNPAFEGNGSGLRSDNILQLQLPCHQNL